MPIMDSAPALDQSVTMSDSQSGPDVPAPTGGRRFVDEDLRGARFIGCDLRGAVMRGADLAGAELDSPWLLDGESTLLVNGVDVAPYVDAELNRRFPGREQRRAGSPAGLRAAWAGVEQAWGSAVRRARAMPEGSVDASVDGEWSFAQTLRHLVMATDVWYRRAILGVEQPYHPIGQPIAEFEADGNDMSVFAAERPSFEEVLRVRAEHVTMVRDFLAGVSDPDLLAERTNPWAPDRSETVLSCVHVILDEEWEHLRYAERDLDVLDARAADAGRA